MKSKIAHAFILGLHHGFKSGWHSGPVKFMKLLIITLLVEVPLLMLFCFALRWNNALAGLIVSLMMAAPLLMNAYGIYNKLIYPRSDDA